MANESHLCGANCDVCIHFVFSNPRQRFLWMQVPVAFPNNDLIQKSKQCKRTFISLVFSFAMLQQKSLWQIPKMLSLEQKKRTNNDFDDRKEVACLLTLSLVCASTSTTHTYGNVSIWLWPAHRNGKKSFFNKVPLREQSICPSLSLCLTLSLFHYHFFYPGVSTWKIIWYSANWESVHVDYRPSVRNSTEDKENGHTNASTRLRLSIKFESVEKILKWYTER